MVMQPTSDLLVGSSNSGQPTVVGGAAAMVGRPGFKPPPHKSAGGRLHYHLTAACSDSSCPPHYSEPREEDSSVSDVEVSERKTM